MSGPEMRAVALSAALAAHGHLVPIGVAEAALRSLETQPASPPAKEAQGGLTRRQRQAMLAIQAAVDRDGVAPSREELRQRLKLTGKAQAQALVLHLEERGYLRRLPYRARALEILRRVPDGEIGGGGEAR